MNGIDAPTSGSATRARIAATAVELPQRCVSTAEVEECVDITRFGFDPGWIERVTGVRERRWADPHVKPSDLAAAAGRKALRDANLDPQQIDTLLFCGITRDFIEPATANVVADTLGIGSARAFDITNACNGVIDGIDVGDSLIRSGKARRVLVTTGETASISINLRPRDVDEFMLSVAGLVISDGGGAVVLEASSGEHGILERVVRTDPSHWRLATGGRFRHGDERCGACGSLVDMPFLCEGRAVLEVGMRLMLPVIADVLERTGWTYEDVSIVFCHEASKRFVESGSEQLGNDRSNLTPRFWSTVEQWGNTSTFSLPLQISQAHRAEALAPGTKSLLVAGGAGFSVAAMTVLW